MSIGYLNDDELAALDIGPPYPGNPTASTQTPFLAPVTAQDAEKNSQALEPSEREFQQAIIDLAKANGWLVYHTYDSRRSEPGFPDLVLTNGRRVVFAEVKTNGGRTTEAQERWLRLLSDANADVFVWRPRHWAQIAITLTR